MFGAEKREVAARKPPTGWRAIAALAGFVAVCLAVGAIGGLSTASSVGTWYQTLAKPSFNPPDWVFAPVWTILYVTMGVAAWRVWRQLGFLAGRVPLRLFGAQLLLNLLWTFLFFGLRHPAAAFFEILLLIAAIVATIVAFRRVDKWAELMMVPYLMWVLFAAVLNGAIWYLN
jgi:tryptophan-rich sensory protein